MQKILNGFITKSRIRESVFMPMHKEWLEFARMDLEASKLAITNSKIPAPYNSSPANLLSSDLTEDSRKTVPNNDCPLNFEPATIRPLLLKSKYGESI